MGAYFATDWVAKAGIFGGDERTRIEAGINEDLA